MQYYCNHDINGININVIELLIYILVYTISIKVLWNFSDNCQNYRKLHWCTILLDMQNNSFFYYLKLKLSIQTKQKTKCKQKTLLKYVCNYLNFCPKNKFNTMRSTLTIWITTLMKKNSNIFFCNCNEIIEMGWWEYVL